MVAEKSVYRLEVFLFMNQKNKIILFGSLKNLTLCAMLTALSVAIGIFCKNFLDFGGVFRITFENFPIILTGILFGPIVGGVVGAGSDLISYLFSNQAYPPNLVVTLGAFLVGVVSGLCAKFVIRKKGTVQIVVSGALAHIVGSMIVKPVGLFQYYQMLVLWRIPIYLVIAPLEILLLCSLLRRKSFANAVGYVDKKETQKMTYDESLEYIHRVNWTFCNPGLDRIKILCDALGNPQKRLKFIHVAGTNGKGSFCAMLSSVLRAAGYKTGLFTSPYVRQFNERIAINGEMISKNELVLLVEKLKPIVERMNEKPTEFELITAIALEYFANSKCDYVVLECGLGGRLDSTNIIDTAVLSVITGIALDHTAILGDTIEKIAFEKAGIIKTGVPILWCGESAEAQAVIESRATQMSAPFHKVDHSLTVVREFSLDGTVIDFSNHKSIFVPLLGEYQPFNASNVLCAIDVLRESGIQIKDEAIKEGMSGVKWHARFEVLLNQPLVIADGAHNPEGVHSAVQSIKKYFPNQQVKVISGVMADKDYRYIAKQIAEVASEVLCITPDNPRALDAGEYAKVFAEFGTVATPFDSIDDAVSYAIERAKDCGEALVCLGSLYMYSQICECIEKA